MTDLDRDLREMFEARAASAAPIDTLDDVMAGVARVPLSTPRRRGGRLWLAVAAAVILFVVGVVAVLDRGADDRAPASPTIDFPADAPAAPLVDADQAASVERSLLIVDAGAQRPILEPENASSPWSDWDASGQVVTDVEAASPAATYMATCCAPRPTIWRDAVRLADGLRIDYELDGVVRAVVDPAHGSVTIGERTLQEPGVVDVGLVDRSTALLFVGAPSPTLVRLTTDNWTADATLRRSVLPLAPQLAVCGLVTLDGAALVFAGEPDGVGRCVSDRAIVVALDSMTVTGGIRLPAETVTANSDHHGAVVAVSSTGDLLRATLQPSSAAATFDWVTLRERSDVVAADFLY